MNTAAAKQSIKQCFQTLKDEQLQQYHLTHDYFSGRPLKAHQMPRAYEETVDASVQKQQRDLACLNDILHPTPTLNSVIDNSLAALKLKPEASKPAIESLEKPSEDLLNRAKNWFSTYQSEGLEELLPKQPKQLTPENIAIVKHAFSHSTLLIQNACMLSAFWIRNPQDWDAKSGTNLLEHLFAQYDAPIFLRNYWSNPIDEENIRWLLCYVMYAQGGSLKALANHFSWTTASSKLWHQLYLCPSGMTPLRTVLYAEFKRLGGWDQDFDCLMENESYIINLLDPISEEGRDFWYDTCRWLINLQLELPRDETRKVLSWARHQLTEYARRGETYRLQGRSKARVLESIADYEQELRQIQQARERMAERARQVSMARDEERVRQREEQRQLQVDRQAYLNAYDEPVYVSWNGHHWNWKTIAHGKEWIFSELTSTQELIKEGDAMAHCVGGYSISCLDQESAIFSLRCEGERIATVDVDPSTKRLIQALGEYNSEPSKGTQSVIDSWMKRVVKR